MEKFHPCQALDERSLLEGVTYLARVDSDLARVVELYGTPPMWAREPGFATLLHIILEQQVSLASAQAAFDRLALRVVPLNPQGFLELNDVELKEIGFSRQKTRYGRVLAEAILSKEIQLEELQDLEEELVRERLTRLKGIGRWSADIYLLMVLLRPDIWPRGDLALISAAKKVKHLPKLPTQEEFDRLAENWRPYRAVAARLLWHNYLSELDEKKHSRAG
jgi:DNA-3-methyladenine glycosylase II